MARYRAVLVVQEENGRWRKQHRFADREAEKLSPMSGGGDVNDLAAWFADGWRVVDGSGFPQAPALNTQGAIIPRPGNDRVVLTLEHD